MRFRTQRLVGRSHTTRRFWLRGRRSGLEPALLAMAKEIPSHLPTQNCAPQEPTSNTGLTQHLDIHHILHSQLRPRHSSLKLKNCNATTMVSVLHILDVSIRSSRDRPSKKSSVTVLSAPQVHDLPPQPTTKQNPASEINPQIDTCRHSTDLPTNSNI